jgi:hypothetical protein
MTPAESVCFLVTRILRDDHGQNEGAPLQTAPDGAALACHAVMSHPMLRLALPLIDLGYAGDIT